MPTQSQIPLGTPIPASIHAVSVSMPTLDDVIGYEEKREATLAKMATGYPRFVTHPYALRIQGHWQSLFEVGRDPIWLTSSELMALRLQAYLSPVETKLIKHRGVSGLKLPQDPELNRRAKQYLQHIGGILSSRQAEDYLLAEGLIGEVQAEATESDAPEKRIQETLSPLLGVPAGDIVLTNSGMNAFFAAFQAVNALQQAKGRRSWVKLGWLYVDTMSILDKLSPPEARNEELLDVFDLDQLDRVMKQRGNEIAGIITEAPTNPLIQTPDLERIYKLATECGAYLLVDPTVNSPANVDVAPFSHIVVNSLTKYAANAGDVIMGAVAATRSCPDREALTRELRRHAETPYHRDAARLAAQLDDYPRVLDQINRNTAIVANFLEQHPKVRRVHWANEPKSAANYQKLARSPEAVGGLLAFEYDGHLADFHDRSTLAKGPSFGVKTTLLCPFIYLAHYDLVTSGEGRRRLAAAGIDPELLRLSVGAEDPESIIQGLRAGLD